MTRCCRDSMNLKSTGQNSVDQLTSYRTMCTHLRRVLLAKCVVDTRNPRYARSMRRRCRPASCKLRFLEREFCCPSDETIDKLAYDTEHHPSEIIRVTCRSKSSPKERSCSRDRERAASNDANCPCPCLRPGTAKGHSSTPKSNLKNQKRPEQHDCPDCYACCCNSKEFDYDKQQQQQRICDSKLEGSPCRSGRSRKWSLHEETTDAAAGTDGPVAAGDEQTFRKLAEREEEEALYAKFVYDITQEIVQSGLYTDRELKEVFTKHIDRNSACLNKRKMLYEIYQLKISLNLMDGSEDEDETEANLVYAEKFSNLGVPKPPTPPKVLNENKVIEKLESFKHHENGDYSALSSPTGGRKSVTLVDANPEFLVTERDFLATLADNQVEPHQIQRIFKNLFQKSKDMSLYEAVQVGSEVAYTHRLKQVDKSTSASSLTSPSYMRDRRQGILRKESTDFLGKSLSPETCRRRLTHLLDKRNEALEKCSKWKTSVCDCRTQPCKEHLDLVEKEKTPSPEKIRPKEVAVVKDKPPPPQKKPSADKKVKVVKQPTKVKKAEKIKPVEKPAEKPIKVVVKKKEVKSYSEISGDTSSSQDIVTEEKQDSSVRTQSSMAPHKVSIEEPEEIEEDIESVIEEPPKKHSQKLTIVEDKPDDEEKEQASSPEKNNDDEEVSSIATDDDDNDDDDDDDDNDDEDNDNNKDDNDEERENESAKYSDDFSDASEDSSDDDPTQTSKTPRGKVINRARYPSMKDYFDRFATIDEQKIWRISEGSSSSSSTSAASMQIPRISTDTTNYEQQQLQFMQQQQQRLTSKAMKKRTSSGVFKAGDSWNARPSLLSPDYYANAQSRYCDPSCRRNSTNSCSDDCRFVRTNCRNLSRPTDCLNRLKQPVLSSESTSTSS